MALEISQAQLEQLYHHAQSSYPQECCGIIVGDPMTQQVQSIHPVRNAWTPDCLPTELDTREIHSHNDRYWIDPADLLQVMKASRSRGLAIIGIYHSHPDHAAIPSECDRQLAWPEYIYIILAVTQQQVTDCRCWQLNAAQQFSPIPLKSQDTA